MQRGFPSLTILLAAFLGVACTDEFDPSGAYPGSLAISVVGGDSQHAAPGAWLPASLQVRVEHANTHDPAVGVSVTWRTVSGSGVELETTTSATDATGIAAIRIRLGPNEEVFVVEAGFAGLRREPARFTATSTSN